MYGFKKPRKFKDLFYGISTVSDGNMSFRWGDKREVIRNRKKFLGKLGIKLNSCVNMRLEHRDRIEIVDKTHAGEGMLAKDGVLADALVTSEKNLFLFLLTADCLPIIFYDISKKVVALAHLGWRNTDLKFVQKIVKLLENNFQSAPDNLVVGIGPAIHKRSYVKKNPRQKNSPLWRSYLKDLPDDQTAIDIIGYNKKQLIDARVREKNIEISKIDTASSPDFFSHTRSKKTGQVEGRFATVIGIKNAEKSRRKEIKIPIKRR